MHTINNHLFRDSYSISLSLQCVSPDLLSLTPLIPLSVIEARPGARILASLPLSLQSRAVVSTLEGRAARSVLQGSNPGNRIGKIQNCCFAQPQFVHGRFILDVAGLSDQGSDNLCSTYLIRQKSHVKKQAKKKKKMLWPQLPQASACLWRKYHSERHGPLMVSVALVQSVCQICRL